MNNPKKKKAHFLDELKSRTLSLIKEQGIPKEYAIKLDDIQDAIEEAQTYHIELQLQNKELERAREHLEISRDEFKELYENAPIGYVSLNEALKITRSNTTLSNMLFISREALSGKFFYELVHPDSQDTFYKHIQKLKKNLTKQFCRLTLRSFDNSPLYVRIESSCKKDEHSSEHSFDFAIIDVSEKVDIERENNFHLNILQHVKDSIIVTDTLGKIIYWNTGAEDLFGYKASEAIGQSISIINPEINPDYLKDILNSTFSDDTPSFEWEAVKKDKSKVWIYVRTVPFRNEKDEITGLIGVSREITSLKESEKKIKRLNIAVEQSANIIVMTDADGHIEYVNKVFEKITGYSKEEAHGKNPRILKSGKLPNDFYKEMWHSILNGNIWQGEFHNKKKNGDFYWENATIAPVKDETNKILGFIAIKEDITEKKLNIEKNVKQEKRFKALVQNTNDIIAVVNKEKKISYITPSIKPMFGYDPEEVIGKSFLQFVHHEDHNTLEQEFFSILKKEGSTVNITTRGIHKDGTVVHTKNRAVNHLNDPAINGIVLTSTDITEDIRNKEKEAWHKKSLELLNKTALKFIETSNELEIFEFIADKFKQLLPNSFIILSTYNEKTGSVTPVVSDTDSKEHLKVFKSIGPVLNNIEIKILENDPIKEKILSGRLHNLPNGLSELPFEKEYAEKIKPLRSYLQNFSIYLIGFSRESECFGDGILFIPKTTNIEKELIEAFAAQATIALQRKKIDRELHQVQETYQKLISASPDAIVITTLDKKIKFISPKTLELADSTDANVFHNKSIEEFLHKDDRAKAIKTMERVFNKKTPASNEYRFLKPDKTIMYGEVNTALVYDETGKPTHFISIIRNITERKNNELKLARNEFQLKKAQQLSKMGSWFINLEDNTQSCSENLLNILPYKINKGNCQELKQFTEKILSPEQRKIKKVLENLKNMQETYFSSPFTMYNAAKEKLHYILSIETEKNKGKNNWALLTIQDVTEEKSKEELRKIAELAKNTNLLKQQFLANMSHEMRTPMTGILGMIGFLENTALNEEQKEYLNIVKESSESLLHLINDILDITRIEAGKIRIAKTDFSIYDIIKNLELLFMPIFMKKGIQFQYNIEKNVPEVIVSDSNRLQQILTNLTSNALKFTNEGKVELSVSVQKKEKNKATLHFSIKDTGIGIAEKDLSYIFSKFSKINNTFTKDTEGAGLGLSITKELTELLGGEIGASSQKGKGSTFWFTIKCQISKKKKHSISNKITTPSKKTEPLNQYILIVEDKKVIQKVVSKMLENIGCKVDFADNGQIAVEKANKNHYDIILMDIQMPVMDGIEATKRIKSLDKKSIPVIIGLSANAMTGDADKFINLGMDDYITKPVAPSTLYEKIKTWRKDQKPNNHKSNIYNVTNKNNSRLMNFEEIQKKPVFNENTLSVLKTQTASQPELLQEIFESFFEDADELVAMMNKNKVENNYEEFARTIHTFKGISGTIGASKLHELLKMIDLHCKKDNFNHASSFNKEVEDVYEELRKTAQDMGFIEKGP